MHEINIAKQIYEKLKDKKPKKVKIAVGELCDFFPEEIKEALETLTGWKVEVIEEESLVECGCGYRGRAEILEKSHGYIVYRCPDCKGKPKVIKGDSVRILGYK